MKEGDFVSPVHHERERYLNREFVKWIEEHKDRRFYVSKVYNDGCVKLAKVDFIITSEFLKVIA